MLVIRHAEVDSGDIGIGQLDGISLGFHALLVRTVEVHMQFRDVLIGAENLVQQRGGFIQFLGDGEGLVHALAGGQAGGRIPGRDDVMGYGDNHDAVFASLLGYGTLDVAGLLTLELEICIQRHVTTP